MIKECEKDNETVGFKSLILFYVFHREVRNPHIQYNEDSQMLKKKNINFTIEFPNCSAMNINEGLDRLIDSCVYMSIKYCAGYTVMACSV